MAFTPPPQVPQRGARATFSGAVDAFLKWMAALPAQLDAFLARLETIAAGGAYAIPFVGWGSGDPTTVAGAPGRLVIPGVQNAVNAIWFNIVDARGVNIKLMFDDLFSSTSSNKGYVTIIARNDPSRWITYRVTSWAYDAATTRGVLGVVFVGASGANPILAEPQIMQITPNGDKGEVGNADKKVQTAPAPVNGVVTVDYRNGNCLVWDPAAGTSTLTITNWPAAGTLGEFWIEGTNMGAAGKTLNISVAINWLRPDGTYANNTSITTNHGVTLRPSGDDTVLLWGRAGAPAKGKIAR